MADMKQWRILSGSWLKVLAMLTMRRISGPAFIPMNLYNGKRGFIKGPVAKYMFYSFYPLHLIVIYLFK